LHFVFHRPFVFENQPMLRQLERLALADVGSHLFDLARFFFGEPRTVYCETLRVRPDIKGEDVATAVLRTDDVICTCHMSYSTRTEHEQFPQTLLYIEGSAGTIELGPDYWVRLTTDEGTLARRHPPPRYTWADPDYAVVHASIVPCNADLLAGIRGERRSETTGEDNLNTMRLVYRAYESAATGRVITLDDDDCITAR
jgi:predicted dehydrogenase